MRWEDAVLGMFDDLEMQAEGLHLAERAVEVDEPSVAQDAEVELVARLHASVGRDLRVCAVDGLDVHGRLSRVGSGWLLLETVGGTECLVSRSQVVAVGGLAPESVPEVARPLTARLSLRSALRALARDDQACAVHVRGGRTLHGSLGRVGADFVDLRAPGVGDTVTVPIGAVVVVRSGGSS